MLNFVLLAMIGAKLEMGTGYWLIYGAYIFFWLLNRLVNE